jgi:hypothetical protein
VSIVRQTGFFATRLTGDFESRIERGATRGCLQVRCEGSGHHPDIAFDMYG